MKILNLYSKLKTKSLNDNVELAKLNESISLLIKSIPCISQDLTSSQAGQPSRQAQH